MSLEASQDIEAPGWDAIDRALKPLYGDQVPRHFGTVLSYRLGGTDPLQGISAYLRTTPAPHWHFVTYGFSELYQKETADPQFSGYGFEMTFRLECGLVEVEPPMWALNFLQNLARYVFQTGNIFRPGDYMNLNGPICLEASTQIDAMAVVTDPELPRIDTPNGSVEFLQIVGITTAEQMAMARWSGPKTMETYGTRLPLYITDLDRDCLTKDQEIMSTLDAGANLEGSMTGTLYMDHLEWKSTKPWFGPRNHVIILGALQVTEIISILPLRLRFGRTFRLTGKESQVLFEPAGDVSLREDHGTFKLGLPEAAWQPLVSVLKPVAGTYSTPELPHLVIEVQPTHIQNQDGEVERTVG